MTLFQQIFSVQLKRSAVEISEQLQELLLQPPAFSKCYNNVDISE